MDNICFLTLLAIRNRIKRRLPVIGRTAGIVRRNIFAALYSELLASLVAVGRVALAVDVTETSPEAREKAEYDEVAMVRSFGGTIGRNEIIDICWSGKATAHLTTCMAAGYQPQSKLCYSLQTSP